MVFDSRPRSGFFYTRTNRSMKGQKVSRCPYGIGFNKLGKPVPLWCGKWSCDRCRVDLAKKWAWRASLHIANVDKTAYFWTLTLRSNIHTAYQGFRVLPKAWNNLRNTMQRKTGKWSYLAFVECHPKRYSIPHFHVLSLTPAPVVGTHRAQPLKDLAFASGFGYIAMEEVVATWKAAWYVAKYASKTDPAIPPRFHRCRASRDWAKLPERELASFLVKARSEHLSDFIFRVSDVTGVDMDVLYRRYRDAYSLFEVGVDNG